MKFRAKGIWTLVVINNNEQNLFRVYKHITYYVVLLATGTTSLVNINSTSTYFIFFFV